MTGSLIVEDQTWDLTGITFYGKCTWKHLNVDNQANGTVAKKITVTAGSPRFYNITFSGSGGGSSAQIFENYSSREIFQFQTNQSVDFINCSFSDIVGGIGTNNVIKFLDIPVNTGAVVNFNTCSIFSHNFDNPIVDAPFLYVGLKISATNNASFYVNVYNQRLNTRIPGINNSCLLYEVSVTDSALFRFNTDGSSYAEGSADASTTGNPTTNARNQAPILADKMSFTSSVDGQVYHMTLTQLQEALV
jgi:hypothetical protein